MAYSGTTTHYGLPKYVSTDKPSWLDTNDGFDAIDQALYAAAQAVDPAQIAQMQNDITALQTGKQNVLTFDATPTNGSVNPVTSGGIYTALTDHDSVAYPANSTFASILSALNGVIDLTKLSYKSFIVIDKVVYRLDSLDNGWFTRPLLTGTGVQCQTIRLFSDQIYDWVSGAYTDISSNIVSNGGTAYLYY